jgi:hypothetical protein
MLKLIITSKNKIIMRVIYNSSSQSAKYKFQYEAALSSNIFIYIQYAVFYINNYKILVRTELNKL